MVCRDDDWRPQWRVDLIPSYKAHRVAEDEPDGQPDVEEVPDDLTPQVDMIMEMLDAFGIATAGAPGYEADDVLGTLADRERRDPVVVVSGDRDLLQLVRDDPVPVRVLYLGRGLAKATMFGPAEVAETLRRAGRPRRAGLRRTGAAARRPVRRASRRARASARRPRPPCWRSTVRWSASWPRRNDPKSKMSKAHRDKLLAATDYIEAAGPGGAGRHATPPSRCRRRSDALPLAAAASAQGRRTRGRVTA